ncbi:uncharacterized protein ColSpa_11731 [Colletotrichum spaethianum]|uniref:Uncharacterized protein n=1 Tax=Colletotrichum spaethianum TaxID=700344 RepID=A0AA37PGC8_9PEZI|nr:uncharacterized protein ColSpa_11731 [Colletotrichum spaethianum]GKT51550.1 hypothetical protein ColSpa_11731 [Colletotrichum spaethianum]
MADAIMADATIVLETHIYSHSRNGLPPWVRSFHLRLSPTGTKADILKLVRDSMIRLGRADPIAEAQIVLYWTQQGRVVSIPGTSNSHTMVTLPIYRPPQLLNFNVGYPMVVPQHPQTMVYPEYPLALTYSGGANYLHSYSPNSVTIQSATFPAQQIWMVCGGHGYVNVPVLGTSGAGSIDGQPVVSNVVRETCLDDLAEESLAGMLEWTTCPNGLKLIAIVDVDGRNVVQGHAGPPSTPVVTAQINNPISPTPASPDTTTSPRRAD